MGTSGATGVGCAVDDCAIARRTALALVWWSSGAAERFCGVMFSGPDPGTRTFLHMARADLWDCQAA